MIIGLWYQQEKLFSNVLDGNRRGSFVNDVILLLKCIFLGQPKGFDHE